MAIGPKQIYNNPKNCAQFESLNKMIDEDSSETIEAFKKHSQSHYEGEFLNGYKASTNILMYAAWGANVNLVKYIAENGDPRILNMRDNAGYTALHCVVINATHGCPTPHKVIQCAQILIQAGADINTRITFRKPVNIVLPLPEAALDENDFCGDNALGSLTWRLFCSNLSPQQKELYELLTLLFLANGARGHYSIKNQLETGWFSVEDKVGENDTSEHAKRVKVLRSVQEKYFDWPKARLLFLGNKDTNSSLSRLPLELIQLIFQKRALLNFEKE